MRIRCGGGLLGLWLGLVIPLAAGAEFSARVVNGTTTFEHPEVGALLGLNEEIGAFQGVCTGTLVGCRSLMVAAHCVCPSTVENAEDCLAEGTTDPALLRVYLASGGLLPVERVAIHPSYTFALQGDVAIVHLAAEATGILPAPINTLGRPPYGTPALVVGYGSTGGPPFQASDYGIKRSGAVETAECTNGIPDASHVCWTYDGAQSSTCSGDSGGPLFLDVGAGAMVAGVISGAESFGCFPPDQVFTTDVYLYRDGIAGEVEDLGEACGDEGFVGGEGVQVAGLDGELTRTVDTATLEFTVPIGARRLRVGLNGRQASARGFEQVENDFDLYVRAGSPPTTSESDCDDETYGAFGFCEIESPAPGIWYAVAQRADGVGAVQITATSFGPMLAGDANCDDRHGAADLAALAIAIGTAETDCPRADANGDGDVDAADLPVTVAGLFD